MDYSAQYFHVEQNNIMPQKILAEKLPTLDFLPP